jgi:hypothetical protein
MHANSLKRFATSNAYWLSPKDRDKADHDQYAALLKRP